MYNLIVIGGGASGCFASYLYKKKNKNSNVLIIEHNDRLLKKIDATGNGKCNFTNINIIPNDYSDPSFASSYISNNTSSNIISIFDDLGIKSFSDSEGRCYPVSLSAKSVSFALEDALAREGVNINLSEEIVSIEKINDCFKVISSKDTYLSKNLLIAVGGINYSSLGSDGSIYPLIKGLGHSFTSLIQSNIYINVSETNITKYLSGMRVKAHVSLLIDDKLVHQEDGELLFKDKALSGIVSFNTSSYISSYLLNNSSNNIKIRVSYTNLSLDEIKSLIDKYGLESALMRLFDSKLATIILKSNNPIESIYNMSFTYKSLGEYENAQMMAGGISKDELTDSLESKKVKGLFFSGDILPISGPCGGYNLTNAFASAIKVSEAIDE